MHIKLSTFLAIAWVASVGSFVSYATAHWLHNRERANSYPFESGFEQNNLDAWRSIGSTQFCCAHSAILDKTFARSGHQALKFQLLKSDPEVKSSQRAEIRLQAGKFGVEYWYRFSLKIPKNWQNDSIPTTLAQWHGVPEKFRFEAGRTPPLFMHLHNGQLGIGNFWDSKSVTRFPGKNGTPEGYKRLWHSAVEKGVWSDWVFHVQWSYQNDGYIEIWKDGVQVATTTGPNTYNDVLAPYLKLGLYIPQWKLQMGLDSVIRREIYVDDVSIVTGPGGRHTLTQRTPSAALITLARHRP